MQLYSFFNSSTSYRVRIALALKGLDYQQHGINIRAGEQHTEEYHELNPSKGVPVLVDNQNRTLTQSMAIIQYLDDIHPEPRLIPPDAVTKARVLELANTIACDMHPVNNLRILGYLTQTLQVTDIQRKAWYQHWIDEGMAAVEILLVKYGHGPYCFGDAPTLADCCLIPQVANALRFGCDLSAYPNVMRVHEQCRQHPAFIQAAPDRQPDFSD